MALGGLGALLVLGLWARSTPEASLRVPLAEPVELHAAPQVPTAAEVEAPASWARGGEPPERPLQPYDRVVEACGFDVEERCVASGCGAVVSMPDLDRFDGWVRLIWEQPGVVGSTAARDLGLPVAWTPCGDALMASPEVMAAQMGWSQELWCVGDRAACDVAAEERYGWRGFGGGARLTRRVFVLD
jgi:hypothetical protein